MTKKAWCEECNDWVDYNSFKACFIEGIQIELTCKTCKSLLCTFMDEVDEKE